MGSKRRAHASPALQAALPLGMVALVAALWGMGGAEPVEAFPGDGFLRTAPADTLRFEGEFGLAVHLDRDSVHVRWITSFPGPGFLQATAGDGSVHQATTPTGSFHRVSFPVPEGGDLILLYGSDSEPARRHRTRVHLDFERPPPPVTVSGVDSIFVVADIHGEYDNMVRVFQGAGLIDGELRWAGGRSHLAVLGDMVSRGMDGTSVLWFLYRLEREAEAEGGRVHVTLGNHELMVMLEDLRYVQPKEIQVAEGYGLAYHRLFDPRHSILGRWLASKPAIIRINDVLMAHGGVSGDHVDYTLESHRDSLAAFVDEDLFYHWSDTTVAIDMDSVTFERRFDFFWGERSPVWYRGYAQSDTLAEELQSVLGHFDSRIHVVGHTPVPTIREGYDGALILVNTVPFADQILRLVRSEKGYERVRIHQEGSVQPLDRGLAIEAQTPH